MPYTGEYEIPNNYVETNLPNITYRQKGDAMRLAHPDHGLYDLVREDDTRWTFSEVSLTRPLNPPGGFEGTPTYGVIQQFSSNDDGLGSFDKWQRPNSQRHSFAEGDVVWLSANADGTGSVGGVAAGAYAVEIEDTLDVRLSAVNGGALAVASGAANGYLRYVGSVWDQTESYFVTAVRFDGAESLVSTEIVVTNNLAVPGSYNTLSWTSVTGAERYRVYKANHGLAGAIGETYETTFKDENYDPDMAFTPPRLDTSLGGAGQQPGVIASFEQRDVISGVEADPQRLWFTALGTDTDLTFHLPILDTDRINVELASDQSATIRHIVPMTNLVILTESTEFVMTTIDSDALTPSSFRARPVSYVGASRVRPVVVNDRLVFCANRGGHVYEMSLRSTFEGYKPVDLCKRAPHLFDGYTIADMALQKAPVPILWCVRSDGVLLGFTYDPEEEVGGWHLHTTQGEFESICVVAEGEEDRIYVVVNRTIDGNTVRFVERFDTLAVKTLANSYHVDCGITYSGSSASTISGFDHLEGAEVSANVNGTPAHGMEVSSGDVVLPSASTVAQIGLPFPDGGEWQGLPIVAAIDAALAVGRPKNPARAVIRTVSSATFKIGVGEDDDELTGGGTAGELTGNKEEAIRLPNDWTDTGQVRILQPDPLPLRVVSLSVDFDAGGS